MDDQNETIRIPDKLLNAFIAPDTQDFLPLGHFDYRAAYGGRGSGKSVTFAKMACVYGAQQRLRILCCREFQKSIKQSFHAELKAAIETSQWLSSVYDVGVDYLRCKTTGTEFFFAGLRHNMSSIKSLSKIDLCIVEEAEDVPEHSWVELEPTIRGENSEIWVIWNPRTKSSPVDKRFIINPPARSTIIQSNYTDNPWFPDVLDRRRKRDLETMDFLQYQHIWEGKYWESSDAQIFKDKFTVVDNIAPAYDTQLLFGADWGFSVDPNTLVRMWINKDKRQLFIDHEAYQVGTEIDDIPELWDTVPKVRQNLIVADSARPETISHMINAGFNVKPSKKGAGSVVEGVEFIKSYHVFIHERCVNTIAEFRYYSYKKHKVTGDVLADIVDANNHIIDAIRYALESTRHQINIEEYQTQDYNDDDYGNDNENGGF